MNTGNVIVIPPYYSGTSFEDIVMSLVVAVKKSGLDIKFFGNPTPIKNSVVSDHVLDDGRYIDGQLNVLRDLIQAKHGLKKILFLDFFNPGLDLFKYSLVQTGHEIEFASLLHGGSFVPGDLYSYDWIKGFENGWFSVNDGIYVPSAYAKSVCPPPYRNKVKVFVWGMDGMRFIESKEKKWDVIFPHRLQADKGVERFISIIRSLPDVTFLVTSPLTRGDVSTNVYYGRLSRFPNVKFRYDIVDEDFLGYLSKSTVVLSCSIQETFGYSVMKSIACGCYPILPDGACYPEFFDKKYLYGTTRKAAALIRNILSDRKSNHHELVALRKKIRKFSFLPLIKDYFG